MRTASCQFQIAVPWSLRECAVVKGVGVVQEAAPVFRAQAPSSDVGRLQAHDVQTGPAQVGLKHEAVVPRSQYDPVVRSIHGRALLIDQLGERRPVTDRIHSACVATRIKILISP